MKLHTNMNGVDRGVRLVAGMVLLVVDDVTTFPLAVDVALLILGLILIATAAFGFCPLYRLLGISSLRPRGPAERPI